MFSHQGLFHYISVTCICLRYYFEKKYMIFSVDENMDWISDKILWFHSLFEYLSAKMIETRLCLFHVLFNFVIHFLCLSIYNRCMKRWKFSWKKFWFMLICFNLNVFHLIYCVDILKRIIRSLIGDVFDFLNVNKNYVWSCLFNLNI